MNCMTTVWITTKNFPWGKKLLFKYAHLYYTWWVNLKNSYLQNMDEKRVYHHYLCCISLIFIFYMYRFWKVNCIHDTFLRWYLRPCCARMKEYRSFRRKSIVFNRSYNIDCSLRSHLFLSYHLIYVPWLYLVRRKFAKENVLIFKS